MQRRRVEGYIAKGRDEGARLVLGGGRPDAPAATSWSRRSSPTSTADDDRAEEIFGPVVAVIPTTTRTTPSPSPTTPTTDCPAASWGPDVEHAKEVARRIRSGNVAINQHTLDLGGPFGGFKQSGLGREYGLEGIEEYVEVQSIPYVREPVQR